MVVELREQLVHTNTSFATEIADLQETVSEGLVKLLDRVAKMDGQDFEPSKYIKISLIPPVVLILQLIEMTLSSVGNIGGVFQQMQMNFSPWMFLKSYVPHIDWDKFKEESDKYAGEMKTKTILGNDGAGEGGGY